MKFNYKSYRCVIKQDVKNGFYTGEIIRKDETKEIKAFTLRDLHKKFTTEVDKLLDKSVNM